MKEINQLINHFVWRKNKPTVSDLQMAQTIENGGVKLTAFEPFTKALKLSWIKRIFTVGPWQTLFYHGANLNKHVPIWELDPKSIAALSKKINNPFWKEVLNIWSKTIENKWVCDLNNVLGTPIWYTFFNKNRNVLAYENALFRKGVHVYA